MSDHPTLTLAVLQAAVAGGAAAIRAVSILQPAGGPGDKVFPPTYATDDREPTKYALEERQINGSVEKTVLLDSVASQANRMEEALEEGWREGKLRFPVVLVDFSPEGDLADLGEITALRAPHRIADALLRDSLLGDVPFRASDIGRSFTDARVSHATAMYSACPTALVFGVWDSTGPKGGLGAKFQRALVSEIIGVGVSTGVKTASRIDPAGIEIVPVYVDKDKADDWTADEKQARKDKGAAVLFERKGEGKGKPSTINHGNIAPSIDKRAGGVTMAYAQQTTVLSLPALRKLRFAAGVGGAPLVDRPAAEQSARVALAALGLAAVAWSRDNGYGLRSRADLVPTGPLVLELLPRDGGEPARYQLDPEGAAALLDAAAGAAAAQGMGWETAPVRLRPAPKLVHLIRQSRAKAAKGEAEKEA
jgi:CRISPR-associated protein Csb1